MRCAPRLAVRCARTHAHNVGNRIPFAIQLADLLRIYFERKGDLMVVLRRFGMHGRNVEPAARSRVQDAHQRSLRIAIANLKSLHSHLPSTQCVGSSSSSISDKAAPDGTIGKTFASGAQSNTSSSGSGEDKKLSIRSPVSDETGNSRIASSLSRRA